jgi:hypothetical protein
MQVEALVAHHGATVVSSSSGVPARRPARLPVSRPASSPTPWRAVSTQQRVGDHAGAARLDRHDRPPLPAPAAAPESSDAPTPSEPAPQRQQCSPRWLSPPSLADEVQGPSTLSPAFEGSCTAPAAHNASGSLTSPNREFAISDCVNPASVAPLCDGANRRLPALPGRRRLRRSASGPPYSGGLPIPSSGPLAAAPPLRTMPPTFSARRSPVTRDFAPKQGFKQRWAQIAELSIPASRHPDRSLSPLIGGRSTPSAVGAQPATDTPGTTAHSPSLALTPGAPA